MVKKIKLIDIGEGLREAITYMRYKATLPEPGSPIFLTYGQIATATGIKSHHVRNICIACQNGNGISSKE